MKTKFNWKEIIRPAATLTIICLLITAALAVTDSVTKAPIAALATQKELASRQQVLPQAASFEEIPDTGETTAPCKALDASGNVVGYVIVTSANGYGGSVKVMTGIQTDGTVAGITILEQSETVGLGANCEKETFRNQFVQAIPQNGFSVYKAGQTKPESGGVEALTSATITSSAVVKAVNSATDVFHTLTKGGN